MVLEAMTRRVILMEIPRIVAVQSRCALLVGCAYHLNSRSGCRAKVVLMRAGVQAVLLFVVSAEALITILLFPIVTNVFKFRLIQCNRAC